MSAAPLPSVTQQDIDEAEALACKFGLTYLSQEGYAKLAALLLYVQINLGAKLDIPKDCKGWRVG